MLPKLVLTSSHAMSVYSQELQVDYSDIVFGLLLLVCSYSLHENCPYSEFFWSVFFHIWTEDGKIWSIQSKCGKMRTRKTPNTDTFHAVNLLVLTSVVVVFGNELFRGVFRTLSSSYDGAFFENR